MFVYQRVDVITMIISINNPNCTRILWGNEWLGVPLLALG